MPRVLNERDCKSLAKLLGKRRRRARRDARDDVFHVKEKKKKMTTSEPEHALVCQRRRPTNLLNAHCASRRCTARRRLTGVSDRVLSRLERRTKEKGQTRVWGESNDRSAVGFFRGAHAPSNGQHDTPSEYTCLPVAEYFHRTTILYQFEHVEHGRHGATARTMLCEARRGSRLVLRHLRINRYQPL